MPHGAFSTAWTPTDIIHPSGFHYFRNRFSREIGYKFPVSLNTEDNEEIFLLLAVIQKTIVPDFLKAVREHMHHQTADKFIWRYVNNDFLSGSVIFCLE